MKKVLVIVLLTISVFGYTENQSFRLNHFQEMSKEEKQAYAYGIAVGLETSKFLLDTISESAISEKHLPPPQ